MGKVGIRVECATCGQMKQPIGRSAPMEGYYCDWECSGYREPPHVGSLWPGETDEDFGYPCGDVGTLPTADSRRSAPEAEESEHE
jgi:hypothetical protein